MQIVVILIAAVVWLLIFWLGSTALEATGMERSKARFQALSAITGTGFTTREAESIVNHPKRRQITTWLIFTGNVGITAFIVGLILSIRAGIITPSPFQISIILAVILVLFLFIKLGAMDKLTSIILRLVNRRLPASYLVPDEVLHQASHYGVARIMVRDEARASGLTIKDTGFVERGIMVLAIERGATVLSLPEAEEEVLAGDYLLCYGKVEVIFNKPY